MTIENKIAKSLALSIVYTYFLIFPFGQLLRLEIGFAGRVIPLLSIDIVASLSLIYIFFIKKPMISKHFYAFFAVCLFSLLLSLNYFSLMQVFIGSLYFLRLIIYFSFFVLIWNLTKRVRGFKLNIISVLTASLVLTALLGWIQYFFFADLTFLKFAGWDDHLGRLVGTYLDPAFTGMIFVSGFLIVFLMYLYEKRRFYLLLGLFFLISLLLTYSRASYLALLAGFAPLYYLKKKIKAYVLVAAVIFIFIIPLLPRGEGEGVRLERTRSAVLRLENYKETLQIIKEAPLFGVGFNNICWVRMEKFPDRVSSHSCFGSDSSLLLILATSGISGFLIFLNSAAEVLKRLSKNFYGDLAKVFFSAIFIHSLFSNSLFYPWIMGLSALFLALSSKE
jgi:hypothetical protein